MNADWRRDRVFLTIVAVSLLLKVTFALLARHDAPVLDEEAYLAAAEQVARGDGFPGTFRPPGYPAFMAAVLAVGAGTLGIRLLQVVLSIVSVWSTYRLGHRFGGPTVARVAAAIVAFDPVLIAFTHRLWSETVFIAVLLVVVDLLTAGKVAWTRLVAAGFLLGLGALVRPMILTFVPFLALWFVLSERRSPSRGQRGSTARGLGKAAVILAVALAPIAPWTVRNLRATGTLVLIDSNSPFNLLVGAEPGARFVDKDDHWALDFGAVDGVPYVELVERDARRAQSGAVEAAWRHVRSDVPGFIAKSLWEAGHLWTLDSFLLRHLRNGWYRIYAPSWAIAAVTIVSALFFATLGLAGLAGLVLSSGSTVARLGLLLALHSTLLFGATYALSRYAVPLRPMLALGVASLVVMPLREQWRRVARWQRATVMSLWVLLSLSWIRDVPLLTDMVSHRGASHRFTYIGPAGRGGPP